MKAKNKVIALLEIAIVLCSVFLVALPATGIATDQTIQKVSASEVTTASEDDFILEIYGNANEDDCIDMRDYTHTARIICWLEEETTFADANYDGRISVADMTQIGLIILGRESELTIVDSADRTVTVRKPVEKIVTLTLASAEATKVLKAQDKVVGVGYFVKADEVFFPKLSMLPSVGYGPGAPVDYEKIFELNPDIVIVYALFGVDPELEKTLEPAGIMVVRLDFNSPIPEVTLEEIEKLGYLFDMRMEAEEFIDYFTEEFMNPIKEKAEKLQEEDKPRVYFELYSDYNVNTILRPLTIVTAGGIDICADLPAADFVTVEPEWVVQQDPEIIVREVYYSPSGYEVDDPSGLKAERDAILTRPELAEVTAIKEGNTYAISYNICDTLRYFVGIAYMAKWFHPDLFEDLDPKAIHQEYLTRFQGLDIDLDEKGVFVYHPELHPDGR